MLTTLDSDCGLAPLRNPPPDNILPQLKLKSVLDLKKVYKSQFCSLADKTIKKYVVLI